MKKLMIALLAICMSASVFAVKKDKPKPEELLLMIEALQAQVTELQAQVDGNSVGIATNVTGISKNSINTKYSQNLFQNIRILLLRLSAKVQWRAPAWH